MILVLGDQGFLGSSLIQNLKKLNIPVDGLNRNNIDFLNLQITTLEKFLERKNYQYAVICVAITDVEKCYQDQETSKKVNVLSTKEILTCFQKFNIIPIFISSDYVFANNQLLHSEDEIPKPETVYGNQKLVIEDFMVSHFKDYLIFRTSKLMSLTDHPKNIIYPVVSSLKNQKSINCFTDQFLNPVFVEDIAKVISLATAQNLSGLYHLGTKRIFSRYDFGKFIASELKLNAELIQPISLKDIQFSEQRPTHNILDCQKIEKSLNFKFTELAEGIHNLNFRI